MTLQLPSFLDASSDKRVAFEIMILVGKKFLKLSRKLRRKLCVQLVKKSLKFDKKIKKENRGLD